MAAVVECGCGEVLQAEDEQALLAEVEGHVGSVHPELIGTSRRSNWRAGRPPSKPPPSVM